MTQVDATQIPAPAEANAIVRPSLIGRARVLITLADQGLVSVASFATTFLLLRHFEGTPEAAARNFAYFTLAGNLIIWASEFQAALVFTPHTILTPRLSGDALRRFHGSTLIHNTALTLLTVFATLVGAACLFPRKHEMAVVLAVLAPCLLLISLRNYVRPYAFAARTPISAFILDFTVAVLQIGGLLLLKHFDHLEAWTATAMMGAACLPAVVWLYLHRHQFQPSVADSITDVKNEWPHSRFVFLSGMVWNAGMQLYVWLIAIFAGDTEVAVWGACYQLACVANPLMMGMQNFIGPRIAEACIEMPHRQFTRHVYKIALLTTLMMAAPAVLLSIYAGPALVWLSKGKYTGHATTIAFLCGAIVVQAITFTLSRGLFALKRADLDLYCNFLPLITLLTFGVWATHAYGVTGAAASLLVAQLLSSSSRGILFWIAVKQDATKLTPLHPPAAFSAVQGVA